MDPKSITYNDLPPECLLRVIEFLSLTDVTALLRTSTLWNSLISENENAIYCRLANYHEPNNAPLGSLEAARKRWVSPAANEVQNWKQYCEIVGLPQVRLILKRILTGRLQTNTRRRWIGKEKAYLSRNVLASEGGPCIDHLKIDTEKSLLAMTVENLSGALNHAIVFIEEMRLNRAQEAPTP